MNLEIVKIAQKETIPQRHPWDSDPPEDRYMVIEKETKRIVDDARGYGFKSFESAKKAMWYRFDGGKQKIDSLKSEAKKFWKANPEIKSFVNNLYEYNVKEIALGEISEDVLVESVNEKFNITINKKYFDYA